MSDNIFRDLQERLDSYSLGFPATKTGIEITVLKRLFTEKNAEMFLNMSPLVEEPATVSARLGKPLEEVAVQLEDMAQRGLLFRLKKGESLKYGAIPFMHGLMEFHVKRLDREMVEIVEQYFDQGFHQAIADVKGMFLRTVPVHESITVEHHIAAFEDARAILEKNEIIAVTECVCRKEKNILGKGCGKPLEACFMFGSMARYYIDNKMGRRVNLEEAIELLAKAQEAGLVTQPGTAQNPAGMCNCCGDCCGVIAAVKKYSKPAELVFSNYQAVADRDSCTGCEICLDRCQMDAITMIDGVAEINLDRCIGCGLCVTTCPVNAMSIKAKDAAVRRIPPATSSEQMMQIARNRGII
ncbi:MAG: 4Fe-4S ferredoxin [Deltaproteobacteria bacterium HGW-Deltaproteobacteria-10]|nr:MAG: 4Fe-4S ferredoxin [Deltaproteobacteria bacterium HGW-Deltaproteobacteria-10]